jgi:hypothetical protein
MKQDVEEEIIVMVAALEACELRRTDAQNAGSNLLASSTNDDSIVEPVRRISSTDPPKRFRRRGALWASITRRMIFLAEDSTRSPLEPSSQSHSIILHGARETI